jgi:hypothetical protein
MNNKLLISSLVGAALVAGIAIGTFRKSESDPPEAKPKAATREGKASRSWFSRNQAVTVPAGTQLSVRLHSALSTKAHRAGEEFAATLTNPVYVADKLVIPAGSTARGVIVESNPGGRVKGVARLGIRLTEIVTPNSEAISVSTEALYRQARATKAKDATKIGIGSGIGAAIGAIAGGGKGAAIGAGAGAGAGTGVVLATRGDAAVIPSESVLTFRLREPVTAKVAS